MRKIGPHSRPDKLQIVDGRLAEAQLMHRVHAELIQHLGGKPSATQRILIDRAAAPSLRIHLMDRESARSGGMSERNGRQYRAWSNSLTRVLNQIGSQERCRQAAGPPRLPDRPFRPSTGRGMTGRPSTYSQEIADEVCRRLAGGESLRAICRDEGIPDESTVRLWALDDRDGFAAQYARAREVQFSHSRRLLEIADDGRNDWMQRRGKDERGGWELNGEHIQRSRAK